MRGLARLLTVLGMAAAVVAVVIHLERRYAPSLVQRGAIPGPSADPSVDELTSDRWAAIDSVASDDSWSHVTPLDDRVIAGLAARLHWNDDASKRLWLRDASGWDTVRQVTDLRAASSPETPPPDKVSSQAQASARPIETASGGSTGEPSAAANVQQASLVEGAGRGVNKDSLRSVEPMELMRQLRSEDNDAAAQARTELIRRGFTEVDLELARRFCDPDPEVRKRLARSLPGLQSVDAAAWLLPLCRDSDAEVRMTAVTLMATTGDPGLLEQVESIARQDADPRIRDLADQIAEQRSIAGSRGGAVRGARFNASRGGATR